MRPPSSLLPLLLLFLPPAPVTALGINCRGSGLCPMATWDNKSPLPIMQIMRDFLYASKAPPTTPFTTGSHILCVSDTLSLSLALPILDPTTGLPLGGSWNLAGNLKNGGICLFPQYLKDDPAALTLGEVRLLVDKLLEHGCGTCGSVPVHFVDRGSNDPGEGILTFNYVRHPYCTGNCLSDGLVEGSNFTIGGNKAAPSSPPPAAASGAGWNATEAEEGGVRRRVFERAVEGGKMVLRRVVEAADAALVAGDAEVEGVGEDGRGERRWWGGGSVRIADLVKRAGEGDGGMKGKGWIGWLMG